MRFKSIQSGDWFLFENRRYIKIVGFNRWAWPFNGYAVSLETGDQKEFPADADVEKIEKR